MPHRTPNPLTAFYGDMRETGRRRKSTRRNKYQEGSRAYYTFFGKRPPSYYGSAVDMYRKLEAVGFVWSTRCGWRLRRPDRAPAYRQLSFDKVLEENL